MFSPSVASLYLGTVMSVLLLTLMLMQTECWLIQNDGFNNHGVVDQDTENIEKLTQTHREEKCAKDPDCRLAFWQCSYYYPAIPSANWVEDGYILYPHDPYPNAIFFHLHIPKSGGTNFRDNGLRVAVYHNCGIKESWTYDSIAHSGMKDFNLAQYMEDKKCRSVSFEPKYEDYSQYIGNFWPNRNNNPVLYKPEAKPTKKESLGYSYGGVDQADHPEAYRDLLVFALLRRPIDHVRSMISQFYKLYVEQPDHPNAKRCLGGNLSVFYDPLPDQECAGYNFHNQQVWKYGGGSLDKAKNTIESVFGLGLESHYEESMCLWQWQLGQMNKTKCNCEAIRAFRKEFGKHPEAMPGVGSYTSPKGQFRITRSDLSRIMQITMMDEALHVHASKIFIIRMYEIWEKSGHKVLCDDDVLNSLYD